MSGRSNSSQPPTSSAVAASKSEKVLLSSRNELKRTPFNHTFTVGNVMTRMEILKDGDTEGEKIASETLSVRVDDSLTFYLLFTITLLKKGDISVFMRNKDSSPSDVIVEGNVDVLTPLSCSPSPSCWRRSTIRQKIKTGHGWGWSAFITKEQVETKKAEFLQNDALTINFNGSILTVQHSSAYSERSLDAEVACKEAFFRDFTNFRRKSDTCDVAIICNDKTLLTHSFILRMRSDVFAAMLDSDMQEKKSRQIRVADVKLETMVVLIAFVYGDWSPANLDAKTLGNVLAAADKYNIPSLVQACVTAMATKLDRSTCIQAAITGYKHSIASLQNKAMDFILGCGCAPRDLPGFDDLEDIPELRVQIADHVLGNQKFKKRRTV